MKWTSIFSPSGIQVRDDRGRDVPLFNWHTAATSVKEDPQLAGIQARLQTIGTGGLRQKVTKTQIASFAFMMIVQVAGVVLFTRFGMPQWAVIMFAALGLGWFATRGQRFEFRKESVDLLLAHERCACCGYPLSTAHPDEHRCVTCAECGSAWLVRRIGTHKTPDVFADVAPMRKARAQVVDGRLMTLDARDRYVPIKSLAGLRSIPADTRLGECASAVRRALLWTMIRDIGLLALVIGALVFHFRAQLRPPAWGWNLSTLAWVGMACLVLFAIGRGFAWASGSFTGTSARCARAIIKGMVSRGFCPSCAGEVHQTVKDSAGNLICNACGAAWPSREVDL